MSLLTNKLLNDENGFLVSAELVLIFTLVFCGVSVGISVVRDSIVQELGDVAEAIGALNQSSLVSEKPSRSLKRGVRRANASRR